MQLNFAFILEDKSAGGWEMHLCGFYSSLEKHTEHFYHFAPSQPYSFEMRLSIERAKKRMHSSRGMGFSLNHKNRLNYRRLYLTSFATQEQNQKLTKNKKKKKEKKEQIMMHFFGAAIQSVPREPSSECRWWCCCSVRDERIQLKRKFLLQIARFCSPHYKETHRMKNSCKTWFAYTTRHFFLSFTLNDANMILHTLDANWFHKKNFYLSILLWMWVWIWFGSVRFSRSRRCKCSLFRSLSLFVSPYCPFSRRCRRLV